MSLTSQMASAVSKTVTDPEQRDAGFRSLQESIDTTTSGGKLIFHVFGALAEFERDRLRDRTRAGLVAARARGKNGGRKRALTAKQIALAQAMHKDPGVRVADICRTLRVSRSTFYRYALMTNPDISA